MSLWQDYWVSSGAAGFRVAIQAIMLTPMFSDSSGRSNQSTRQMVFELEEVEVVTRGSRPDAARRM